MGKYLDLLAQAREEHELNESDGKTYSNDCINNHACNLQPTFDRLNRFFCTFSELERRCPAYVEPARWQVAVEDAKRFLAQWGEQAETLGWTGRDLFELDQPPADPHPRYSRLARYDHTGLVWLLQGNPVVALTATTAAIRMRTGSVLTYRKHGKPALGPLGDCVDDFK
jgi:hypothetical protein